MDILNVIDPLQFRTFMLVLIRVLLSIILHVSLSAKLLNLLLETICHGY